jgi:hypothetical protein
MRLTNWESRVSSKKKPPVKFLVTIEVTLDPKEFDFKLTKDYVREELDNLLIVDHDGVDLKIIEVKEP